MPVKDRGTIMTDEKGHIRRDIENIKPGGLMAMGIIIMAVIAVVIAVVLEQDETKIDPQKDVYSLPSRKGRPAGKSRDRPRSIWVSEGEGYRGNLRKCWKRGRYYIAMLWRPPRPDHIKIQKITKVKEVEPDQIIGFWRGVSGKIIDTIFSGKGLKVKDSIHHNGGKK